MKALAIFLIVLCLAAVGGILYLNIISTVSPAWVQFLEPQELRYNPRLYDQLKSQLELGTYTGTRFSRETLESADHYVVYTWIVHLENNTSLDARAVEIRIAPHKDDILQFDPMMNSAGYTVKAHQSADIRICVLSKYDSGSDVNAFDKERDASVTWYLGGFVFPEANGKGRSIKLHP